MLNNLGIWLTHISPHSLKHLSFLTIVFLHLLIRIRKLNRHKTINIFDQLDVIYKGFIGLLFVVVIVIVFYLFEKSKSVNSLKKLVVFAKSIYEFFAFIQKTALNGLIVDFIKFFFSDVKRRNKGEREGFTESFSEKDKVVNCPLDSLWKNVTFDFNPKLKSTSNAKESSSLFGKISLIRQRFTLWKWSKCLCGCSLNWKTFSLFCIPHNH